VDLQGTYLAAATEPQASAQPKPLAFSLHTSGLTLANANLAPAKVEVKVGDSALVVSVAGENMSTERLVTGSVAVPPTSARKLLQSFGIAPPVTRDSRALSVFGLQTNFRLTRKQLQLSALQLTLDDTRVQGSAAIEDLAASALSFDLNVNGINVDRYRAPVDKTAARPAGPPAAKMPPTPLPLEALRKLDARGILRVANATFSNIVFTDAVLPLAAKDGDIRLGPTQARLYGGSYNGDIVLDARPAQAQLSLNQHVHGIDIAALMKAAFDSARISGHADANVAVTGVGNTDDAIKRSLSGKIDANVKQGALIGIDIAYELQRANALLKREVPPQRTGPARTVFNTLETKGTLDKGVLRIDDLRMETDRVADRFLKVHGRGTLDMATEAINYQLVTSVNKLPAGGGGQDALGSVDVPLTITGTLSSPTVRPDIEALAKGKLGQEVQQKAGELVKKKLGDKLKDLFGH
jgi:AsmA protein